ncbi:MAG: sigma-54 interaction domain-containing protein, partial [Terriglobia bacterium]
LHHAVEQLNLTAENRRLQEELYGKTNILGDSVPMKALRQQIGLAAPTSGRVMIYGESGVGKELVARALHQAGARAAKPFVEVNCAAIPEELIESELFGHVKGSFTGAVEDKTGKFEQADTGTLFLDEIGDMSLRTQAKVLRALEEQRFTPVGSSAALRVDVRVITATNKDLHEQIEKGNFREDLFYRLNVIPFYVPALRDHAEDVPALASYFLAEFARTYGRRSKQVSEMAMESMIRYRWPGNVRELRNLIERLVIMVPGARIERRHLPPEMQRCSAAEKGSHERKAGSGFANLHDARSAYEREYILRKLEENRGNVSRAAEVLGLERSHLYRKMKSLGITSGE